MRQPWFAPLDKSLPAADTTVAGSDYEVAPIPIEQRPVEYIVVLLEVYVRAIRHCPVLVVPQEQVLSLLVEEPAFHTLTLGDPGTERSQERCWPSFLITTYS